MNTINIADILQDKPKGTKLYSPAFGDVTFDKILGDKTYCIQIIDVDHNYYALTEFGQLSEHGNCMLYPSSVIQDWDKFQWERGDVLTVQGRTLTVIFDSFADDKYTKIICKHSYFFNGKDVVPREEFFNVSQHYSTEYFYKVSDKDAQEFIKQVEEHYGGTLDPKTLEIEKQPEFKDGDIVTVDYVAGASFICICKKVEKDFMYCHARVNSYNNALYLKEAFLKVNLVNRNPRYATDYEKQKLLDVLAKESKRWNAETKTLEDLLKKCAFKAFDKVLVRDTNDDIWSPKFFAEYDENCITGYPYGVIGSGSCGSVYYTQCISYEGNEHLLGKIDEP